MRLTYAKYLSARDVSCLGRWCLLFGPEHRLKREVLARFREEAEEGTAGEEPLAGQATWEVLEGPAVTTSDLLSRCQTVALFAGARVVVVHRAERIDAREQEPLAKRVGKLPPSVSVVLVTAETGGRRQQHPLKTVLQRAIEKQGFSIEFSALKGQEAAAWAVKRAKEVGKTLERAAARKLAEQKLGTGLGALELEIEKLASFVGERKTITSADVEEVTPRLIEEDIFRLVDAVAVQSSGRAVAVLRALLRDRREVPARILPMIAQAMREIWQFKLLTEHGWRPGEEPQEEVRALLPVGERRNVLKVFANPRRQWQIPHRIAQASSFSWARLARAVQALHDCDLTLKGAGGKMTDESMAIELLVIQLCRDLDLPLWDSEMRKLRPQAAGG
jgi:DNA polymerase-3 subunit delta